MRKFFAYWLALTLLVPQSAWAIPTMNSATGSSAAGDNTFSHTTTVGATLLVVGCSIDENSITQTVTYGGEAMTSITSLQHATVNVSVWLYYLANPLTGSNTVFANNSSGVNETNCVAADFSVAATTAPTGAVTNETAAAQGTALSVNVTCPSGDLAISMVATSTVTNFTPNGTRVLEVENVNGTGAMMIRNGEGTTLMSEDPDSVENIVLAAACITAAATTSSGPIRRRGF
jgi:hypothetical protein